ncbi:electron transfer flavoprotein-ubiquinone oxidoreductase [Candidatus Paracaedimonas acanthamoebae]|nr:electron transfer flavoprotein-ubiquinone oxidoreductase [Candidatus Paracaedimonas acanthamoebae]
MGDALNFDVVIVGAGPAGLSAAIRLKQLCAEKSHELSICVLEKGAEVGAHILSGAVLEPRALNELIPEWKEKGAPLETLVQQDKFLFLTEKKSFRLPTPPPMKNHGNYIISLGNFCRWLAGQAEALGVEIYPGFSVGKTLYNDRGKVIGVETTPRGLDVEGRQKDSYEPGVQILARHVVFAEGCRGSLSKELFERFHLNRECQPQTYGLGIKELWEIKPEKHQQGLVVHTLGWPLDSQTYGGSFIYHLENQQLAIGFVIGLDYENPYLSPYDEFQRFKHHPAVKSLLEGGRRISYGARALNEGGWQSIPRLSFRGGSLVGCAAGFLNVPKIKGTHTAMKSGMIAAEVIFDALSQGVEPEEGILDQAIRKSWIAEELKPVRNIRPGFQKGLWAGLVNAVFETISRGKFPWTLKHREDHHSLKKAKKCIPISYPKPDGVISFDKMSSVYLSNTNHAEDQPCHLQLKDSEIPISYNLANYAAPEQRYCPAGVYEIVQGASREQKLHINAQNCVHCKACDIKDPLQNINWVPPEGGDGPRYPNM